MESKILKPGRAGIWSGWWERKKKSVDETWKKAQENL